MRLIFISMQNISIQSYLICSKCFLAFNLSFRPILRFLFLE